MTNPQRPGVYVKEVPGNKSIAPASTSIAGFVGIAEKGPKLEPKFITSFSEFFQIFGGPVKDCFLYHSVKQFFTEGGGKCYILRVCLSDQAKKATLALGDLKVTALTEGAWANSYGVLAEKQEKTSPTDPEKKETFYTISLWHKTELTRKGKKYSKYTLAEKFENLMKEEIQEALKGSKYLSIENIGEEISIKEKEKDKKNREKEWNEKDDEENIPLDKHWDSIKLQGGDDGLSGISEDTFVDVLEKFDTIDDVSIMAIPDLQSSKLAITAADRIAASKKAAHYCRKREDCLFLVDAPEKQDIEKIKALREKFGDNSYAAFYYPWIRIQEGQEKMLVPPCGAIAGICARTDDSQGVHKAPAGVGDGEIVTAIDFERPITDKEQDILNPIGINALRFLKGGIGHVVWGARTLSLDSEWKYVNVRRLFLFLKKSLYWGSQWVVFKPNNPALWDTVKRTITSFLKPVWRSGALFGTTEEEAFFVKIDAENNPPETRDQGQLIIDIGVAPVKPAEFVIINISQKTQSS